MDAQRIEFSIFFLSKISLIGAVVYCASNLAYMRFTLFRNVIVVINDDHIKNDSNQKCVRQIWTICMLNQRVSCSSIVCVCIYSVWGTVTRSKSQSIRLFIQLYNENATNNISAMTMTLYVWLCYDKLQHFNFFYLFRVEFLFGVGASASFRSWKWINQLNHTIDSHNWITLRMWKNRKQTNISGHSVISTANYFEIFNRISSPADVSHWLNLIQVIPIVDDRAHCCLIVNKCKYFKYVRMLCAII